MKKFKILSLLTVFALVATPMAVLFVGGQSASAAPITDVNGGEYAASDAGAKTITFTNPTALVTTATIDVTYDTAFTGGASLTDADITVTSSGTNITASTETGITDGYFRSTITGTAALGETITITIGSTNFLTAPATSGNYSVSVAVDADANGTAEDLGAGLMYVADDNDVTVTAIVPPTIDMELYQAGVDAELVDPNTCALGVLSLNAVNTCSYDIGTGTNNATGVTVQVTSDGALTDGTNDIDACAGTSCDSKGAAGVDAGQEEYGFYISELGAGEYTASGSFGTQHQAVPTAETVFATTSTTGSGTNVGEVAQRMEVTHAASMDTATVVGSYSQLVTYTAYTN